MNRETAWTLLTEYTRSESLLKHALAVEAAMRHHAHRLGQEVELWDVTGLLHDFDDERWPNPPDHTREGARILRQSGVDEEIVGAILSHADWNHAEFPLDRPSQGPVRGGCTLRLRHRRGLRSTGRPEGDGISQCPQET